MAFYISGTVCIYDSGQIPYTQVSGFPSMCYAAAGPTEGYKSMMYNTTYQSGIGLYFTT